MAPILSQAPSLRLRPQSEDSGKDQGWRFISGVKCFLLMGQYI